MARASRCRCTRVLSAAPLCCCRCAAAASSTHTAQVSADDMAMTQGAVSAAFHAISAVGLALYAAIFRWQGALGAALGTRIVSLPFWVGTLFVLSSIAVGRASGTWETLSAASAHPPAGSAAGRGAPDDLAALADDADAEAALYDHDDEDGDHQQLKQMQHGARALRAAHGDAGKQAGCVEIMM
mmetsp:Transcript_9893/g.25582  ORF Transcript_9893/g.25582 Transcript_9893/m.25582 type:complete len:184 (+) Transcript_9893:124-675(+)